MKTVFITCIRGIISRNILSTRAFEMIAEDPAIKVIILAPENRVAILKSEYESKNVEVVGIPTPPLAGVDKVLWVISTNLLWSKTRDVQRRAKLERDRNYFDYILSRVFALFGRWYLIRALFRTLSAILDRGGEFDYLFLRYKPTLLFATDVYEPRDMKLVRSAMRNKVRVVGMVRSWDNVTSKTLLNVLSERILVNAEQVRDELIRYGDAPRGSITMVGVPHYDRYLNAGERMPREIFFRKLGADPAKRMILFTPPSDRYIQGDPVAPVVLEELGTLDASILVRTSLVGRVDMGNHPIPKNVVFDDPGMSPDFTDVHLNPDADRHLADSLYHATVVITWASTMIIDAALFNKPIILIGFDAKPRPYGKSIQQYYDYEHQRHIIETGGVRLVKSPGELVEWVKKYLQDPALDAMGRERIVEEHCGPLDGKAGERLGKYLLEELKMKK